MKNLIIQIGEEANGTEESSYIREMSEGIRFFLTSAQQTEFPFVQALILHAKEDASLFCDDPKLASQIATYYRENKITHIYLKDGKWQRVLGLKIAQLLDIPFFTGVKEIRGDDLYQEVYQANMLDKKRFPKEAALMLLRTEAYSAKEEHGPERADKTGESRFIIPTETWNPENILAEKNVGSPNIEKRELSQGLATAKAVLVVGHGIGSRENAQKALEIAKSCGFEVGATRPVVSDGWLGVERLIGISGTTISPDLCIVLGSSGSQAFWAGISESRKICAVNIDEDAYVFKKCDYGIHMDCMEFLEKLSI